MSASINLIQYWDSETTPDDFQKSPETPEGASYTVNHLVFNKISARAFLEENFSEREVKCFDTCGTTAMRSNYFRYHAVAHLGGMFMETGWELVGSFQPVLDSLNAEKKDGLIVSFNDVTSELELNPIARMLHFFGFKVLLNGVLYAKEGNNAFYGYAGKIATRNIESRVHEQIEFVTGVGLLTYLYTTTNYADGDEHREFFTTQVAAFPELRALLDHFNAFIAEMGYDKVRASALALEAVPLGQTGDWFGVAPPQSIAATAPADNDGPIFAG